MTEPTDRSQYQIPSSPEVVSATPEVAVLTETERAYQAAMEAATGRHDVDPSDIDLKRAESLGAATLVMTQEQTAAPSPEVYFDPLDHTQFLGVGAAVVRLRELELAA